MTCGIYLITNKINGHMYVGQSIDIQKRFNEHKNGMDSKQKRGGDYYSLIDTAIIKYGKENFLYQIITELPLNQKLLNIHEKYWIEFYNTFKDKNHYNQTEGGNGVGFGKNHPNYLGLNEQEICEYYKNNIISIAKLAELYGCSATAMNHILKRNNVILHNKSLFSKYKKYEPSICKEYQDGFTVKQLSEKYHCNTKTITNILRNNNIPRRDGTIKLNEEDICVKYQNGMSLQELAQQNNCSHTPIVRVLHSHNISIRKGSPPKVSIDEELICYDYKNGMSQTRIAKKYGISRTPIRRILKSHNFI